MDKLYIRTVTEENWRAIVELQPFEHQKEYISSNAESLLEAFYETRLNWSVYGLYVENYPVGFAMIGAYNEEKGYIWLDRFMLDAQFQGQGYGKKFLCIVLEFIGSNWKVKDIVLSINQNNHTAKTLYEKFGFKDTGRIDEDNGERIMVLNVTESKT